MKHSIYKIDEIGEMFDCEVQNRNMPYNENSYAIFYCWLNNNQTYIGLNVGDSVTWNKGTLSLRGKIADIDRTYYDGTCPVLYVKLTPACLKKWLEKTQKAA